LEDFEPDLRATAVEALPELASLMLGPDGMVDAQSGLAGGANRGGPARPKAVGSDLGETRKL
jgi:hypothetical protein